MSPQEWEVFQVKLPTWKLSLICAFIFVMTASSNKFGVEVHYIYLSDGTEIDENDVQMSLETGMILHLLRCVDQ